MSPEFKFTLDLAQLVMLAGLVWGLARMSKSVDILGEASKALTTGLDHITNALSLLAARVLVLEDRTGRRQTDRGR